VHSLDIFVDTKIFYEEFKATHATMHSYNEWYVYDASISKAMLVLIYLVML